MSRYPDWVNQFKKKGTSVKKVGDSYYLYSNTSKYVRGKKYPQPIQSFIGIITPDGVVETHRKKVSLTDIEVYEYGFSTAILSLCSKEWKKKLGKDWYDVICNIIISYSDNSYVLREGTFRDNTQLHHKIQGQGDKLFKDTNITVDMLFPLKKIYIVYIDHKTAVSKISKEQQEILDKYGITIGGDGG